MRQRAGRTLLALLGGYRRLVAYLRMSSARAGLRAGVITGEQYARELADADRIREATTRAATWT